MGQTERKSRHTFELLAPAGSPEIFKAVLAAGADAVYVGGRCFGARAYADNFSDGELIAAIEEAHLHGRKVYLTVNTLLKNIETKQLYEYLLPFYEHGLDAVLVQDLGVLRCVRAWFPELAVHASTQMTVTSAYSAGLLGTLGVTRAVLSRELSLAEIKQIHEATGMELEVFVHGALCYSYSGQCLLSSMLGGRSGNRGRCAQPCRLPYAVLDEDRHMVCRDSYVLSLKDLCALRDLHSLADAGVYSLKIEGRMKQLPYAAGVVSEYRRAIDRFLADGKSGGLPEEERTLLALGNRCGFTDGYYHKKNGRDMVTFEKPGYETTDEALMGQIRDAYGNGMGKLPVRSALTLHRGEPAAFHVEVEAQSVPEALRQRGTEVTALGPVVLPAQKQPLLFDEVGERMKKTGDTPFRMTEVSTDMDEACFLPNGALNQLRRTALTALLRKLLPLRQAGERRALLPPAVQERDRLICLLSHAQLAPVLKTPAVTTVVLEIEAYPSDGGLLLREDFAAGKAAGKEMFLALPRVFRQESAGCLSLLTELAPDGVLVRNYEELAAVRALSLPLFILTDYSLPSLNDEAAAAFLTLADAVTVPLELNRGEILHRNNKGSVMVVYGYYPLMVSAQCVRANTIGCDRTPGLLFLRDRKRTLFPVQNRCAFCHNVIYNSLPTELFPYMQELREVGIRQFRLDFSLEDEKQTKAVLSSLAAGQKGSGTNGHYKRGVE